ncbi:MAG TPA: uroporphyrinogen-III C-methyltransferase [Opitutaceae bacterium]|jgi:uroporphyrinogen III methyltransferase/synthase
MVPHGVYLVGAGPGPADLLTVRALRLVAAADVIIHDHLVSDEVLAVARRDAERIFVGKQAGRTCRPQGEIDALLVERGLRGGVVVRLKGGDPFIFGRGGEEAESLHAAGVPFFIVPGITAALAAGAFAGIPLTHRAHSSAVVFLTGHEDPAKAETLVRWESYAKLDATLCIYMGVKNLPRILDRLTGAGLSGDTPAALIQCAADPSAQRVLLATASSLAETASAEAFASPALAIVGPVAAFAERLNWFGTFQQAEAAGLGQRP